MTQLQALMTVVFFFCCLLVIGLHQAVSDKDRILKERLKKISLPDNPRQENIPPLLAKGRLISKAAHIAAKFSLFKKLAGIVDKSLTNADIPLKSEEFIITITATSLGSGLLGAVLLNNPAFGLLLSGTVALVAVLWLRMAIQKRITKFNAQIGDSLVLIANSLRSGHSFLQAMDTVRKEMPPPIAREFGRTFQEMHLGTPTEEALKNLAQRVASEDLDLVVTAVIIQRQVGGNLAEVLDNIAHTIRERIRIKGEIKTITAQGKISGLVIGMLPPALAAILTTINPSYLKELFTHPLGWNMLAAAVVMEIVGILLIRKIVNIEV